MSAAQSIIIPTPRNSTAALVANHWHLYTIEGALLALFMISACAFTALLEHPASPLHLRSPLLRRGLIGLAMAFTAILLIYSKWGRRSGAHLNPALTLSFLRLGKIGRRDAAFYVLGQFLGGVAGVGISSLVIGPWLRHPAVNFAITVPRPDGIPAAWLGEFIIALILMSTVLTLNRIPRLGSFTGYFAAALLALYITIEAPFSGMSLNPARTFASALWANQWMGLWVYFTAPVAGMLAAVEVQRFLGAHPHALCGRLSHCARTQSIFHCNCTHAGSIATTVARG
jgi:aquaporin Z